MQGITEVDLAAGKRRGWKTADKEEAGEERRPVAASAMRACAPHKIKWFWVKGATPATNMNERADPLANRAIDAMLGIERVVEPPLPAAKKISEIGACPSAERGDRTAHRAGQEGKCLQARRPPVSEGVSERDRSLRRLISCDDHLQALRRELPALLWRRRGGGLLPLCGVHGVRRLHHQARALICGHDHPANRLADPRRFPIGLPFGVADVGAAVALSRRRPWSGPSCPPAAGSDR